VTWIVSSRRQQETREGATLRGFCSQPPLDRSASKSGSPAGFCVRAPVDAGGHASQRLWRALRKLAPLDIDTPKMSANEPATESHYITAAPGGGQNCALADPWILTTLLAIVAVLAAGTWIQQQVHLNHDVGWILHSSVWLLEGRRFGSDIVDPNPPLIWFITLPAAALVKAGWFAEPSAIRIYFWLLCAGSLALCTKALLPMWRAGRKAEVVAILSALAVVSSVLCGRSFGQREFLAVILGMPYCLLIAGRLEFAAAYSRRMAVALGVVAGLGIGLKPWLVAVPVCLEVVFLLGSKNWRRAFRAETLSLAASLLVYALIVVTLTPDYFRVAVPLARAVYWFYARSDVVDLWAPLSSALSPVVAGSMFLVMRRAFSAYSRVFLAALAGYTINYWMQGKGFEYHLYPTLAVGIVFLVHSYVCASSAIMTIPGVRLVVRQAAVATLLAIVVLQIKVPAGEIRLWLARDGIENGVIGPFREALITRVRELTQGQRKRVFAFSTQPYPGFPTVNYVNAEWAAGQLALFALPAYVKRETILDPEARVRADWGIARQRDMVVDQFITKMPDIVLVNTLKPVGPPGTPEFDFIDYYRGDPRFAAQWRGYAEVKGSSEIRIFVRQR
jgi:hypothetical protein